MTDENAELTTLIARGFIGVQTQIQARDDKVSLLSDKMIGVEFKIDQLKESLTRVEVELSKADTERIKIRVDNLEAANERVEARQSENRKWIWGLFASVIVLLVGFLFNIFTRIGFK